MAFVNGTEHSWVNMRTSVAGVAVVGVEAIKYAVKQEKTNNYGIGAKPVSRSYGTVEYEGSITLHMSEVEAFIKVAPNGNLTEIAPFDIVIAFVVAGRGVVKHHLRDCEFMNDTRDMKQGDTKFGIQLDLIIGDIEYGQ